MTICDIYDYLMDDYCLMGDRLDMLLDEETVSHLDIYKIRELSYAKTAIDEVCNRLRFDLGQMVVDEDMYQLETMTIPSWDILLHLSESALAFSDYMCNAANKAEGESKWIFTIASQIAKKAYEYLYLATGGN